MLLACKWSEVKPKAFFTEVNMARPPGCNAQSKSVGEVAVASSSVGGMFTSMKQVFAEAFARSQAEKLLKSDRMFSPIRVGTSGVRTTFQPL